MRAGSDNVLIPCDVSGFPHQSGLNGQVDLSATWNEVLTAAVTVGKWRQDFMNRGRFSVFELIHRLSAIEAYFDLDQGRLTLSTAHDDLDPTEKGVVAYYLGMTLAKLYASKMLGVPWLMHLSRYAPVWSVTYGAGSRRPDLFGVDATGQWVVAEAKGRQRVTQKLIQEMKAQARSVAAIDGVAPKYSYGSATRFQEGKASLRVVDPPAEPSGVDVPLKRGVWLLHYYGRLVSLMDRVDSWEEGDLVVAELPDLAVEVVMPSALVMQWREFNEFRGGVAWREVFEGLVAAARDGRAALERASLNTVSPSDGVVRRRAFGTD